LRKFTHGKTFKFLGCYTTAASADQQNYVEGASTITGGGAEANTT
jgi:hypothetical protein